MTLDVETVSAAPPATEPLGPRRMSARLRVDVRLARRQVWRTRGSSALVLLLVALPVAAMVGAAVFWQSHVPTRAQEVSFELGDMQARIEIVGGVDPTRWQSVDQSWDWGVARLNDGTPVNPESAAPETPDAVIPAGSAVFPVTEHGSIRAETSGGVAQVGATAGQVWDPAFAGRFRLLDGERPTSDDEAMATPGMLERLGVAIGDAVVVAGAQGEPAQSFTITGTLRRGDMLSSDQQLFLPADASGLIDGTRTWFVEDWQPDVSTLQDMNVQGFVVYARDLVLDPPDGARVYEYRSDSQQGWAMLATGSIVAVFSGYLVVLLAGAAFAVAARRQQRSLAVAASVGASRSDIFRVVVLQGTVLGGLGGILGAGIGFGLAALAAAVTDRGAVNTFWGVWGYNVPWPLIVGILVFAVVVGTLSAIAPARAATRGDVLGALRGARRPLRLDTKRPLWGLVLMIGGVGAAIAGAAALLALDGAEVVDYEHPLRVPAQFAIVLGPIVFQLGVLMAGHWIITVIARLVSRLSLPARIASRDAAANPSRVVPAFAAIAACVFLASFGMSAVALSTAGQARTYSWGAPLGGASIGVWGEQDGLDAAIERARSLADEAKADDVIAVSAPVPPEWDDAAQDYADPGAPVSFVAGQPSEACPSCGGAMELMNGQFFVVSAEGVETLLDQDLPDGVLASYAEGSALVADPDMAVVTPGGTLQITTWRADAQDAYYAAMDSLYSRPDLTPAQIDSALPDPDAVHTLPAVRLDGGRPTAYGVLIAPATAERLASTSPCRRSSRRSTRSSPMPCTTASWRMRRPRTPRRAASGSPSNAVRRPPTPGSGSSPVRRSCS
ncbi:FtsX-like permease family protein [Microbacterium sp. 179-B 1A2 NHS]|uniref:FtsX-like permease family protein n=1 Tax=Microbacterium sp. 179-B 1A2 NHS TaxID=3142383 RepID=UPI0039A052E3